MANESASKFFPTLRRAYIARHAFEFGQVNRKQLCEAFDISPPKRQRIFKNCFVNSPTF